MHVFHVRFFREGLLFRPVICNTKLAQSSQVIQDSISPLRLARIVIPGLVLYSTILEDNT
jgi:hypothetical protein